MNDTTNPQTGKEQEVQTTEGQEARPIQRRSGATMFSSPFDEMERLFSEMSRGLMRPFGGWPEFGTRTAPFEGRQPKVDLIDRGNEIVLKAELPGVKKDDLEVAMSDNGITIRATTSHEEEEEKGDYHRKEMSRGEFVRTVPIPETIDEGKVAASFKDGILELRMPKVEEARPRQIKVE